MRKIAVINQKGGVGKTTTVANISSALAAKGMKVLMMDLDPQAHLTIHLGGDRDDVGRGAYEVLTQHAKIKDVAEMVRDNLWLLGANIDLVGAESELVSVVGREIVLREALEPVKDRYDYLIIDCPPSLGLLTLNALTAVKEVFIPLQPHFLALQGLGKLLETVTLVSRRINPSLIISAIILCMFDSRITLSAEVKADIEGFLEDAEENDCPWSQAEIIPVQVRRNIKLAEAPSYGKSIFEYEPYCNGAEDYRAVASYIHENLGPDGKKIEDLAEWRKQFKLVAPKKKPVPPPPRRGKRKNTAKKNVKPSIKKLAQKSKRKIVEVAYKSKTPAISNRNKVRHLRAGK